MESTAIAQQVRGFIIGNYLFDQYDNLKDTDSFLEVGILDSTGVLELVAFLEEKYGITVKDDELTPNNLDSINNIVEYLARKLASRPREKDRSSMRATGSGGHE